MVNSRVFLPDLKSGMRLSVVEARFLRWPGMSSMVGSWCGSTCSADFVFEYMDHDLTGLASTPGIKFSQAQSLTSRVVTMWYRPPELLLGSTDYGPLLPGRTEVVQIHKIFRLSGSPSEEYWRRSRFQHVEPEAHGTTSSALQSEFFTTKPFPSDPSSLPRYQPRKEFDIRLFKEEARRELWTSETVLLPAKTRN
ncbi:putative serine/threonine-protein kinase [Raphanus sativus]|nr:putative serine/threonine-protein kinase [Raphanus sativus]